MYIDKYGLINSKPGEEGAENSLLWSFQQLILLEENGEIKEAEALKDKMKKAMLECKIAPGLFLQTPSHVDQDVLVNPRDRYMSPDQLITFVGFSYRYGYNFHKEIWSEIERQGGFKYDNVEPRNDKSNRWIRPWELVFYAYCAGKWWAPYLIWITALARIESCTAKKEETSGKLLAWVKCHVLKEDSKVMNICYKICTALVNWRNGSWAGVFKVYFPLKNHPNPRKAEEVY